MLGSNQPYKVCSIAIFFRNCTFMISCPRPRPDLLWYEHCTLSLDCPLLTLVSAVHQQCWTKPLCSQFSRNGKARRIDILSSRCRLSGITLKSCTSVYTFISNGLALPSDINHEHRFYYWSILCILATRRTQFTSTTSYVRSLLTAQLLPSSRLSHLLSKRLVGQLIDRPHVHIGAEFRPQSQTRPQDLSLQGGTHPCRTGGPRAEQAREVYGPHRQLDRRLWEFQPQGAVISCPLRLASHVSFVSDRADGVRAC